MPLNRSEFHKLFKSPGPVVLPVIHVLDETQTARNVELSVTSGAAGVFLINHDFGVEQFLPIIRHVRARFPSVWLGVNFLAVTGLDAFPVLGTLAREGCVVDAYWADDARIDEAVEAKEQVEAIAIASARSGWDGMYFGGTAFKKQREVAPDDYFMAATQARGFMDVVTTSGVATGHAADRGKIETFRRACHDTPLAIASGITPENALDYAPDVDAFLVATGVSAPGEFHELDAAKLEQLLAVTRRFGATHA